MANATPKLAGTWTCAHVIVDKVKTPAAKSKFAGAVAELRNDESFDVRIGKNDPFIVGTWSFEDTSFDAFPDVLDGYTTMSSDFTNGELGILLHSKPEGWINLRFRNPTIAVHGATERAASSTSLVGEWRVATVTFDSTNRYEETPASTKRAAKTEFAGARARIEDNGRFVVRDGEDETIVSGTWKANRVGSLDLKPTKVSGYKRAQCTIREGKLYVALSLLADAADVHDLARLCFERASAKKSVRRS